MHYSLVVAIAFADSGRKSQIHWFWGQSRPITNIAVRSDDVTRIDDVGAAGGGGGSGDNSATALGVHGRVSLKSAAHRSL
eukprot:6172910-Pleurochrysis_carterae.AAC.1